MRGARVPTVRIAVVLAVVAMAVLAMPALGSSHTSVAVVSEHSTTDEFTNGNLTDGFDASGDAITFVAPDGSETFTDSGTESTWVSPVTGTATFDLWGPGGGDGADSGGTGGYVSVEMAVEQGEEYTIVPGSRGGDGGFDGAGGAGGSGLYDGGGGEDTEETSIDDVGGAGGGGDSGVLAPDGNEVASAGGGGGGGGFSDESFTPRGGGGAQGGSGYIDGGGPGSHGGDADGNPGDDAGYAVSQGTELAGQVGGGNDGDGEIQVSWEFEIGTTATYTSATHDVTDPIDGFTEFSSMTDIEATVTWEAFDGSSWSPITSATYTSAANHTQDVTSAPSDMLRVNVTATVTGSNPAMTLDAEGITATNHDPTLSDPAPTSNTFINERPIEMNVTVADTDFPTAQGDSVTVEFYNGNDELEGTDTFTSNGTATATYDDLLAGENEWYAVATDATGAETRSPTTGTHTFETVGELDIRNETTLDLLNDTNVEVRFFQEGVDDVVTRNTTDGTIDMSGLDPNQEFVAVATADGYHDRRIVISSLFDQQTLYLLNETEDTVEIEFELDDRSRDFPTEETQLRILRPLGDANATNSTYRVIAGDYFGATNAFPVDLVQGDRYRLEIENDAGQIRELGTFIPVVSSVEPLTVGRVTVGTDVDDGWIFGANTYTRETTQAGETFDQEYMRVGYVDREGITDSVTWEVRYTNNETVVYGPQTWTFGNATQDAESILTAGEDYPADANLEVAYTVERGDSTITDTVAVGGLSSMDWPIGGPWVAWMGMFTLVGVAALFGGRMSRTGGLVVVFVAFSLSMLGVLTFPPAVLGFALVAALLFKVAATGGPGGY